ncbi:MAG: hypothetical protein LBQ90_03815 [Synergistaceae bacterium]|nr:hypothetical protein [Synergistaceae bacterium]
MLFLISSLLFLFLLYGLAGPPAVAAEREAGQISISLVASPDRPLRGETVTLKATAVNFDAERHGIHWEWSGGATNLRTTAESELVCEMSMWPTTISATVWDRIGGEDLAAASLTLDPRSYTVKIRVMPPAPTSADVKVRLWDDASKALKEAEGYTVNRPVVLEASSVPGIREGVRCVWTPGDGVTIDSQTGARVVVHRETTGTGTVSLRLVSSNGVELGNAEVSFDVTISAEAIERSLRFYNGWERWKAALALRGTGEPENALLQARVAAEELIAAGMREEQFRGELERFVRERNDFLNALTLSSNAASLWRDGRPEDALMQYRQAQALYADPRTEQNITELERVLKRESERRANAASLGREAALAAEKGELETALAKYGESLSLHYDPAVRAAQVDAEGRFRALQTKIETATMVRRIALTLEAEGDLENALAKMSESREIYLLPETAADLERIRSELQIRQNRRSEAARLSTEAATLETRGLEDQGNLEILAQALAKYRQVVELWPDVASARAAERTKTYIDRIQAQIAQVALLVKEAERLEGEGRLEEAMSRYRRAQSVRQEIDTRNRMTELARRIEARNRRMAEARELYTQALALEKQGRFDEALTFARRGEEIYQESDLTIMVRRLAKLIEERNGKMERAAALADRARQAQAGGKPETALDLFIESDGVWHDDEVARSIELLRGLVSEDAVKTTRAEALYKEAVILHRDSRLDIAEEKLRASMALASSDEVVKLLTTVQKARAEENWAETLKMRPPELRAVPIVPRVGERTVIRIENGGMEGARYRWSVEGAIRDGNPGSDGQTYAFYPADARPVTVTLAVLREGTDRTFLTRSLSLTAEPYSVVLTPNEGTKSAYLWNETQKRLEEVREYSTGVDIEIRSSLSPLPDGPVLWLWTADPDTAVLTSGDSRARVRRVLPGTVKLNVVAKSSRDIVIGEARLSLPIMLDKNDIARDARRAEAWKEWLRAEGLWENGKRLPALAVAARARVLDPNDPDLSVGAAQMKEDLDRLELSARLLSESSWLLSVGRVEDAGNMAQEAESLRPGAMTPDIKYALQEAGEKARLNATLAVQLRSEGTALLQRGRKVEALLRFQDSLLLEGNDAVSGDVRRLTQEITEEKARLAKAGDLRAKGNAMVEKKRYIEALKLYEQSLPLFPDTWLRSWMDLLQERAAEETVARDKASVLRKEGDALMKDKKTTAALDKYRDSLRVWQDDELEQIVRKEEDRIAQAAALALRRDAEALIKRKRNEDAVEKYRESLKFAYNETADNYVKRADAAEAKVLIKEGDDLLAQKKPQEALRRYGRALEKTPTDKTLIEKIRKLEAILNPTPVTPRSGDIVPDESANGGFPGELQVNKDESASNDATDLVQADALFREGNALYREKKYREALLRYRESWKLSQSRQLKEFADQLERALDNMEKANKLVHEANALYRNKKYSDALIRYRESLRFHKNPEVEAFIPKVEAQVRN